MRPAICSRARRGAGFSFVERLIFPVSTKRDPRGQRRVYNALVARSLPASKKGEGGPSMLHLVPAFSRIGEENAFAVLARAAGSCSATGATSSTSASSWPISKTPPHIVEAAIKALRDGRAVYPRHGDSAAARGRGRGPAHRRFGVDVRPISCSSRPAARSPCSWRSLCSGAPGVDILYPDPGFPIYRSMIEYSGTRPCRSPCARRTASPSPPRKTRADERAGATTSS